MSRANPLTEYEKNRIIEEYQKGTSKTKIAKMYGHGHQTVHDVIHRAIISGKIQERNSARVSAAKQRERSKHLALVTRIANMYKSGKSYAEIGNELHYTTNTVYRYITFAFEYGLLTSADSRVRGSNTRKFVKPTKEEKQKAREKRFVQSTLTDGQGIRCTAQVAATCIYGSANGFNLCRYSQVTGKCRSVGKDACSWKSCTKYSKISSTNPRLDCMSED